MKWIVVFVAVALGSYVLSVLAIGLAFPPVEPRNPDPRDRFADVLGSKLAYRVAEGNGPTLLLLHGFGGSLTNWEGVAGELTKCGRVISVDLLGFGRSSRPFENYELETHRLHVLALMDELGIDKAVLVGRSFGASLTIWTAGKTPDRILGAVAAAPSGMPGQLVARWPTGFLFRPGVSNRVADWISQSPLSALLFEYSMARQAFGIAGSYDDRFATTAAKVEQPTLLLWSPGDDTAPFSYSEQFLRAIPQAKLIRFPDSAGHDPISAEPELSVRSICEFVRSLPR